MISAERIASVESSEGGLNNIIVNYYLFFHVSQHTSCVSLKKTLP